MRTRILVLCTALIVVTASAHAQPARFITLKPAISGKVIKVPGSTRRSAPPPPLNSGALLAAVKSSTKAGGSATADYVNLSANHPFVNNKGVLSAVGGVIFAAGDNGGAILLQSGQKSALGIFLIPNPADKTYLVDVSAHVFAGESLQIYSPDGSFVNTTYATAGDQHLLLMVTPQNYTDVQQITIMPSRTFIFYSCKISVLK